MAALEVLPRTLARGQAEYEQRVRDKMRHREWEEESEQKSFVAFILCRFPSAALFEGFSLIQKLKA